jgi:hypothetical protein
VAPGREHVKQKDVCGVEQPRLKEFEECHIGGDLWGLKGLASLLRRAHRQKVCESFRR